MTNKYKLELIKEWNQTEKIYPKKTIHQLFEEQVLKTPKNPAVIFEDQKLTYLELNEKSNQLAHYLRKKGVTRNTLVAICLERSLEMIIGILAILKAGGAYVPLDPFYPDNRLKLILKEAKVTTLIVNSIHLGKFFRTRATIIDLDRMSDLENIKMEPSDNPKLVNKLSDPVYIIYTSGSTGQPNGIVNQHLGLTNRLKWMQDTYRLTQKDKILQKTPFTFDVSVWEFFWPLITGAQLIIAKPNGHEDPNYIKKTIINQNITTIHFVPSMLQSFLRQKGLNQIKSLKRIICSGEILTSQLQHQCLNTFKKTELYNLYGPTESSIDVTAWDCKKGKPYHKNIVPIGKPISNIKIYILKNRKIAPINTPGELCIAGVGLAKGYLNRPKLTKEKFIKNPFSNNPNDRLYKTGDLARWLPDGNIEFLGRIDNQIKIRGFRIEPEEIEAHLTKFSNIQQAVVVAKQKKGVNQYLAAYLKLSDKNFNLKKLLNKLRDKLPEYMIPSIFFRVKKIPLTSHGKINRTALKQENYDENLIKMNGHLNPRHPIEKQLVQIWEKLLNLSKNEIGIDDNFFQLGGHSLVAIQLISRIQQTFSTCLTIKDIFQYPTILQLTTLIDRKKKRKSIKLIKSKQHAELFPLSPAQEQIWFHGKMAPELSLFNELCVIKIPHKIDLLALEKAINYILQYHCILRANFIEKGQKIFQQIKSFQPVKLNIIDLKNIAQNLRKRKASYLSNQQAILPFNLNNDLLVRFLLIKLEEQYYWLSIVTHHLITDAVTLFQILKPELELLYQSFLYNQKSKLPSIKYQYSDYVSWKNKLSYPKEDLNYWATQLKNFSRLPLPTVFIESSLPSFKGNQYYFEISQTLTQQLKNFAKQESVTSFIVLLTSLNLLLHRYTQQNDISIGSITAGRDHPDTENMAGNFLNTLIFRNQMSKTATFQELLEQIKKNSLETYRHRSLPFNQILDLLPTSNKHPLIQVALIMQPKHPKSLLHWTMSQLEMKRNISLYDLSFDFDELDGKLIGRVEYKTELFNAFYIRQLIAHFKHLLKQIIKNSEKLIPEYELLTLKEKQTVLLGWNQTHIYYPEKTICELFEEQVQKSPNKIAVIFEDKKLTYRELNYKVNQFAYYLKKLGVESETFVAISLDRSLELIIAILGVLKAGGAYIPIDPNDPKARIKHILSDCKTNILVTQSYLIDNFDFFKHQIIAIDQEKIFSKKAIKKFNPTLSLTNAAYVIYTSGTTGFPKGSVIEHSSITKRLSNLKNIYKIQQTDRYLHYNPFSFDASLEELFLPILTGATLVIAPKEQHIEPQIFVDWIKNYDISVINVMPVFLKTFLHYLEKRPTLSMLTLKKVISGGDKLELKTAIAFNQLIPEAFLFNTYGPTETTIDATVFKCYPGMEKNYSTVPIGKPIANTQLYVLDPDMNPLPVYIPGELYISGVGVARGYLNRPKLTREKFIKNPFSDDPDSRLYKTGDIVRWLPDGNLEFIGRKDFQVKIRGFRIELGEIEQTLLKHKAVDQAVVVAQKNKVTENKKLCAYVVFKNQQSCNLIPKLRQHLAKHLPLYMIPSVLIPIERLPLTPNGKIDRKALSAFDTNISYQKKYSAPKTKLQKELAKIWAKILNLKRVGLEDNFFEIGGNSIAAINTIAEINYQLGFDFAVCEIYHQPTIEILAEFIENLNTK